MGSQYFRVSIDKILSGDTINTNHDETYQNIKLWWDSLWWIWSLVATCKSRVIHHVYPPVLYATNTNKRNIFYTYLEECNILLQPTIFLVKFNQTHLAAISLYIWINTYFIKKIGNAYCNTVTLLYKIGGDDSNAVSSPQMCCIMNCQISNAYIMLYMYIAMHFIHNLVFSYVRDWPIVFCNDNVLEDTTCIIIILNNANHHLISSRKGPAIM